MRVETLLVALIALLVVLSGVQAFQIATVSSAVAKGVPASSSSVSSPGLASSSVLSQLPTQVGGCG
ncbi:MAG TPA: hypothetical protein VJA47_06450 [archaeon]|nr:hypothetical protein [archaeon]